MIYLYNNKRWSNSLGHLTQQRFKRLFRGRETHKVEQNYYTCNLVAKMILFWSNFSLFKVI